MNQLKLLRMNFQINRLFESDSSLCEQFLNGFGYVKPQDRKLIIPKPLFFVSAVLSGECG